MKTCKEIRSEFIRFFEDRGHTMVPSSSLLPADDPTLLFANAGMNQFKDLFLGREKRSYVRAVNTQKCIRAGGKHNDLEDVGHDTYHHTFFEMLGNWSFGDYFKKEAIAWAWELLTKVWRLPKERLHATVFGGDASEGLESDADAEGLWRQVSDIDPSHIHRGGKKDNFWEMGETGPCGPCSEIHYDFTPDLSGGPLVNAGDARVIEIWNLVFMQFNRGGDGKLSPLPATHVDTGMGLERVARILQGVNSNYGIDLFRGLFDAIQAVSSAGPYTGKMDDNKDVAYRVIADHARALTFAIADGVIPSNEGRGYVLRRILRRAARYGRQYLDIDGPFIVKLVPTIVEAMGESFPEIAKREKYVQETIGAEEESFGRTLDHGILWFQNKALVALSCQIAKDTGWTPLVAGPRTGYPPDDVRGILVFRDQNGKEVSRTPRFPGEFLALSQECRQTPVIPGEDVFQLYATYGFPVDLTKLMAGECGLEVDLAGYDEAMARHRELSGGGEQFKVAAITGLPATDDSLKYSRRPIEAKVLGWVEDSKFISEGALSTGDEAAVVLDRTNFYGESGGQVGDAGVLSFGPSTGLGTSGRFAVRDTALAGQCVLHKGVLEAGVLKIGQKVTATVDPSRFDTMRNHTATHLLNWALRRVLGDHVNQAGSVVAPDRLRFDFTHNQAVAGEQLIQVERLVNERVLADEKVNTAVLPLEKARKLPGVRAVFGEKYPDPVRVMCVGADLSAEGTFTGGGEVAAMEFCGGTHLERTSQVGLFKIVSEESVAKGVRRITAVTGHAAVEWAQQTDAVVRSAQAFLRVGAGELAERIEAMQKELKELRKRPAAGAAGAQGETVFKSPDGRLVVMQLPYGDVATMRNFCDVQRRKGAAAIFVGGVDGQKVTLIAMVAEELVKAGKLKAGDWVKAIAPVVGGAGGGKPTMAQAGGKNPEKLSEALQAAADWAKDRV